MRLADVGQRSRELQLPSEGKAGSLSAFGQFFGAKNRLGFSAGKSHRRLFASGTLRHCHSHHFAHLFKIAEELTDFLNGLPASGGYPFSA